MEKCYWDMFASSKSGFLMTELFMNSIATCDFNVCNSLLVVTYAGSEGSNEPGERSGSVVECLTRDREAADSSLTGVTAL